MREQKKSVLIVGAGASGLTAALTAARGGCGVTLVDRNQRPGRKLSATGNGKCNFTNAAMHPDDYHGDSPEGIRQVIGGFGTREAVALFRSIGIEPVEKNGYYYPASMQASSVCQAFRMELDRAGVRWITETAAVRAERRGKKFFLTLRGKDGAERMETADALILSCGSPAGVSVPGKEKPVTGYDLARQLGHHIEPVRPALCGLHCADFPREWTGVRQQGRITLRAETGESLSETGELQLTEYGISGIPAFQVSRLASLACSEGKKVTAVLNFCPDLSREELLAFLEDRRRRFPSRTASELLCGIFPAKLIAGLCHRAGFSGEEVPAGAGQLERLAGEIRHTQVRVTGTNPLSQAQCAAGGILLSEMDPASMQSRLMPGLFVTGEMLNADGICGGYNLQWAWATGVLAGRAVRGKQ